MFSKPEFILEQVQRSDIQIIRGTAKTACLAELGKMNGEMGSVNTLEVLVRQRGRISIRGKESFTFIDSTPARADGHKLDMRQEEKLLL